MIFEIIADFDSALTYKYKYKYKCEFLGLFMVGGNIIINMFGEEKSPSPIIVYPCR